MTTNQPINLDWYDYGARFYDPQLGRWNVIDPLVENQEAYNPFYAEYHYFHPGKLL
jgi:RHS repeat-associated protein